MSIITKRFQKAKGAIEYLESLTYKFGGRVIFRGHQESEYHLLSTWQRHRNALHEPWNTDIDDMLTSYKVGLEKTGIESFDLNDRIGALEYARHYGVPTPCLDFSYSPYVALFFAFNGVRVRRGRKPLYSVVYALDVQQLALARAMELYGSCDDQQRFNGYVDKFQRPGRDEFKGGFPADTLQFLPFPSSSNKRMQRQMGCLLYDTVWYEAMNLKDFEDYLEKKVEPQELRGEETLPREPILRKVLINQSAAGDAFARLELMNITGASLFQTAEGVAMDIVNVYNYNPRCSYLRDVKPPYLDNGKF